MFIKVKSINLTDKTIDDETTELVSNIITDGIKVIILSRCYLTKRRIASIAEKITNLTNPVNTIILSKKYRNKHIYLFFLYIYFPELQKSDADANT